MKHSNIIFSIALIITGNLVFGQDIINDIGSDGTFIVKNPTDTLFTIDGSTGNVGIGTTDPQEILDVAGTIRTTEGIEFPDGTVQTTAASGEASALWTESGDDVYRNSGNVGIGTNSPNQLLDVAGNIAVSGTVDGIDIATDVAANTAKVTDDDAGVAEVYGAGWDADSDAPTKDDVYDKIESLSAGSDDQTIDDFSISGNNIQLSLEDDGEDVITVDISITTAVAANTAKVTDDDAGVAETYGAGWDADTDSPTKNDVYDKIEALPGGHSAITLNASATTGGMSLSSQEISNRVATNAQTGYMTDILVQNIETNNAKTGSQWTTSGSDIYYYTGKVGIGTASPEAGIDILNSSTITMLLNNVKTDNSNKLFRIGMLGYDSDEEPSAIIYGTVGSTSNNVRIGGGTSAMNAATNIRIFTAANNTTSSGTERIEIESDGDIQFDTNTLFVDAVNNRVGIGTASPKAKLEVAGQVKIDGGSPGDGKVLTSDADGLATWETLVSSGDNFGDHTATQNINLNDNWISGDGDEEGIYVDGDGNVGIGTDSPTQMLDVAGNIAVSGTVDGIDIATDVAANTAKVTDDDAGVAETYGDGWDGDNDSPTKDDVYDKIESLVASGGDDLGDHKATRDIDMAGHEINLNGGYISGDGDEEGIYVDSDGNVGIGTVAVTGAQLTLPQENDAVTPTLAFGDGSSGIYAKYQNQLTIGLGAVPIYQIGLTSFANGSITNSWALMREAGTSTNPIFVNGNDTDTGIGFAGNDILTFIAGGVQGLDIAETGGNIAAKVYGDFEVAGQVKITGGTPGDGKILTSDADGSATWQTPASGGSSLWAASINDPAHRDQRDLHKYRGNIGIGIIYPTARLHILEDGYYFPDNGALMLESASDQPVGITFSNNPNQDPKISPLSDPNFQQNWMLSMRDDSEDQAFKFLHRIGSESSWSEKLALLTNGELKVQKIRFPNGSLQTTAGGGSGGDSEWYSDGGGIRYDGKVGIGNSNSGFDLLVDGSTRLIGPLWDIKNLKGTNGQVLTSTGSGIEWKNGGGGDDNWGTQVVQSTSRLSGDGSIGNLLDIAQQGAAKGQVLKWNGAAWEPDDDDVANSNTSDGDAWGVTGEDQSSDIGRTGNVGIGIGVPTQKLDVDGALRLRGHLYDYNNSIGTTDQVLTRTANGVDWQDAQYGGNSSLWTESGDDVYRDNGSVGVGTSAPTQKLDVDGALRLRGHLYDYSNSNGTTDQVLTRTENGVNWQDANGGGTADNLGDHIATENIQLNGYWLSSDGGDNEGIYVNINGNVGIGTNKTSNSDYKLSVEGKIRGREIVVNNLSWADFVFKEDYNLPTLNAVENYINMHGHLPEIPSDAEVLENGVNLGEMQSKLLQKIEELTLYVIELEKEINLLNLK